MLVDVGVALDIRELVAKETSMSVIPDHASIPVPTRSVVLHAVVIRATPKWV